MTVFSTMIDACFRAPFALSAVYKAGGTGDGTTVAVIMVEPDSDSGLGRAGSVSSAVQADLRVSEVAQPADGDTLTVDGTIYTVRMFERDGQRLVWRLTLREP